MEARFKIGPCRSRMHVHVPELLATIEEKSHNNRGRAKHGQTSPSITTVAAGTAGVMTVVSVTRPRPRCDRFLCGRKGPIHATEIAQTGHKSVHECCHSVAVN